MPVALTLCFKQEMGIAGLWLGFTIACIILDIGFAMIISCPNWQKISDKARMQIKDKGDLSRTPEVRNLRREMTPKNMRTTPMGQNEGGQIDSLTKPKFTTIQNDEIDVASNHS